MALDDRCACGEEECLLPESLANPNHRVHWDSTVRVHLVKDHRVAESELPGARPCPDCPRCSRHHCVTRLRRQAKKSPEVARLMLPRDVLPEDCPESSLHDSSSELDSVSECPLPPLPSPALDTPPDSFRISDLTAPADLQVSLCELATLPATLKPLGGRSKLFRATASRLAQEYIANPSDAKLFQILALPKQGLAPSATRLRRSALRERLEAYPNVPWVSGDQREAPPADAEAQPRSKGVRDIQRQVRNGQLGRAARLLGDSLPIAPLNEETLTELRRLHPSKYRHKGKGKPLTGAPPGSMPSPEDIIAAFGSFRHDTAAGVTGWTFPLLAQCMRDKVFCEFLCLLTTSIASGTCPGKALLCTSRLTPLQKPNGGIRPIAVGELFYRGAMKALLKHFLSDRALAPFQLGVGSKGGVEPILHLLDDVADQADDVEELVSLDFTNAFNEVSREFMFRAVKKFNPRLLRAVLWSYEDPSPLVVANRSEFSVISSQEGVRQGDPLGPLLFSLAVRDMLTDVANAIGQNGCLLAYLDDANMIRKPGCPSASELMDLCDGHECRIRLNRQKSKVVSLHTLQHDGLELLGSCVGPVAVRRQFLEEKIQRMSAKLQRLRDLPRQEAQLLLRTCVQMDLRHLLRSLNPDGLLDLWKSLDSEMYTAFDWLREYSLPATSDDRHLDRTIIGLPMRYGGCGLPAHTVVSEPARRASKELSTMVLQEVLFAEEPDFSSLTTQRQRCDVIYQQQESALFAALPMTSRRALMEARTTVGNSWMKTIPYGRHYALDDREVVSALRLRSLVVATGACLKCGEPNTLLHFEACHARQNFRAARHEHVKKLIADFLQWHGCKVQLEESTTRGNRSRTDFTVKDAGMAAGITGEFDLTIRSLGSDNAERAHTRLDTSTGTPKSRTSHGISTFVAQVEEEKRKKYTRTAYTFTPLVISGGGILGPAFSKWLDKLRLKVGPVGPLLADISLALVRARAWTRGGLD